MVVLRGLRDARHRVRGRPGRAARSASTGWFRPGGPRFPGAWVVAVVLAAAAPGCLREPPPPTDPELVEALGLDPGTPVYRVDLVDRSGRIALFPSAHEVVPGALVQFVTRDRRVYSVHFERDGVPPGGWAFLDAAGQTASPPLVEEGARFVVSLVGAPGGTYRFRVEGQGRTGHGELRVPVDP
jgi:hypothetical protein